MDSALALRLEDRVLTDFLPLGKDFGNYQSKQRRLATFLILEVHSSPYQLTRGPESDTIVQYYVTC
jgi:hypothetical protein